MNVRADNTRPAKRPRLNNNHNPTARPTSPRAQSYLSLVGSHASLPKPEGLNNVGPKPADGTDLLAHPTSSEPGGNGRLSEVERGPPECCYGMVRMKINCPPSHIHTIPDCLRSCVTSPRTLAPK
jgi:hypothetical protein